MRKRGRPASPGLLTPREQEVLGFLRASLTNPEIGDRLGISVETVKQHVSEILSKLGVATREEAAAWQPEQRPSRWPIVVKLALGGAATLVLVSLAILAWGLLRSDSVNGGDVASRTTPATTFTQPTGLGSSIAMAPDTLSGGLYRININGNTVTPIAVPADPADGAHAGYDTFAVSADGRWLAYAPRSPFNTLPQEPVHLFLQNLSSGSSPVDLGTFGQVGTVAVSSQGKVLISGSIDPVSQPSLLSGNAYLVDGGSVTSLPWMQDSYGAIWSPDGSLVAAPSSSGGDEQLKVGDVLGASVQTFTVSYGPIAWSPDGSSIAVGSLTGSRVGVNVLNVRDGTKRYLNDVQSDGSRISWSPDGTRIAFSAETISVVSADGASPAINDLAQGVGPVWSRDGKSVAYTRDGSLYVTDLDTRTERKLGNFAQPLVGSIDWLPDDSGLIFGYSPLFSRSIRVAKSDGSGETHLAYGDDPVWSPDGTMIAFVGRVESYGFTGRSFVYVMNSDGSDPHEVGDFYNISDVISCNVSGLSWAKDSSAVVYYHPGLNEVESAPADASGPPQAISTGCPSSLPGAGEPYPRISPGGHQKLFLAPAPLTAAPSTASTSP